ncbi:stage II sporulation protein P [Clostridium sp. CAG:452]|nr:stage II sporulation protein P [Clostridium sp. CAG:452]
MKAIHQVHGYEYEATGNYRTTDLNYSVARVGTELTNYLKEKGFNVTHNTTYHDYPAYSGSYARSLNTLEGLLEGKNTQLVFDLHRDAVGSSNEYAPTIKINDNYVAQIMFVIGTNGGGLEHPNWVQNLKMAVKIQEKANEMYPGLFRPIIIRNSRYNQHLTNGSSIIEVGATGNTMEQCILSMQCLSNVLAEICK